MRHAGNAARCRNAIGSALLFTNGLGVDGTHYLRQHRHDNGIFEVVFFFSRIGDVNHGLGRLHRLVEDRLAIAGTLFGHHLGVGLFMFARRRQSPDILLDERFGGLLVDVADKDEDEVGGIVHTLGIEFESPQIIDFVEIGLRKATSTLVVAIGKIGNGIGDGAHGVGLGKFERVGHAVFPDNVTGTVDTGGRKPQIGQLQHGLKIFYCTAAGNRLGIGRHVGRDTGLNTAELLGKLHRAEIAHTAQGNKRIHDIIIGTVFYVEEGRATMADGIHLYLIGFEIGRLDNHLGPIGEVILGRIEEFIFFGLHNAAFLRH